MNRLDRIVRRAPLAVALLALFISLGGTSYAARLLIGPKQIQKNAVTTSKIRAGHVRASDIADGAVGSPELADGGIELTDLGAALQGKIGELLDGSVTTAKLANDSVTGPKVAPNTLTSADLGAGSVGTSEIGAESVLHGDIATGAVRASELGQNSVDTDEVANGSLDAVDVGRYAGSPTLNFGDIATGDCGFVILDPGTSPSATQNRAAVVTPGPGFGGDFSFHVEAEDGSLRLKACNVGAAGSDPDGVAGTTYSYIVFG